MIALVLATAVCHVSMVGGLPGPDNGCTPGAYDRLTKVEVCTPKDRPTLRASVRREMLAEYNKPNWTGTDGEIDHRVPFFLGGKTVENNLWPERGSIPNAKDKVEFRVYRRICFHDPYNMRVRTGRRLFLADWRHVYRVWKEDGIL